MPIDKEFIELLRSPETNLPLRYAEAAELESVNAQIRAGTAKNRGGDAVSDPLDQGLVPEGEKVIYPVRDDIPILLITEAIPFG